MKKDDLRILFEEYDKQAKAEAKKIAEIRKSAKGILKTEVIERKIDRGQGIVLAYGMAGEVKYSLEELRAFLRAVNNYQFVPGKGSESRKGVPLSALLRASRPIDIQRSKKVRNATLYQRKGNIIFFQVTGIQQPYYRVQIRIEEWETYVVNTVPVLAAAKKMLAGRLSFECPCGRHQYWYRYMASLGNYAIAPLERGFPKIRNPHLGGCCCKHVLKVLNELKSTRVMYLLAKELERERNKKGFSGDPGKRVLSGEDIRLAQAKRMTKGAMAALQKYKEEAEKIREKQKPRNGKKFKAGKMFVHGLKTILDVAKLNPAIKKRMLEGFAKTHNLTLEELDKIIRENNL